jgi:hypothetical protein
MTPLNDAGSISGASDPRPSLSVENTQVPLTRLSIIALCLAGPVMANSGCAMLAAGTAGAVAADEISEDDGRFDPLENTDAGEEVYEEAYG